MKKAPERFVSSTRCQFSTVTSRKGVSSSTPALFTRAASPPPRPPPVTMTFRPSNLLMSSPFHGARCQAPDEEALAEEVEDDHRERRGHHPRHRHRDVEVAA